MSPEEYRHLKKEQEEMNQQRRLKRNKKNTGKPKRLWHDRSQEGESMEGGAVGEKSVECR